jgi:hypothetical protein
MGSAIDFEGERRAIQRALTYAIRERDQEAAKVRDGVGNVAHLEAMRAKVRLHQDELAEIDGGIAIASEERAARAEAQRLQARADDARAYLAHEARARAIVLEIAEDVPVRVLGAKMAELRTELDAMFALHVKHVDGPNELRNANRIDGIRRLLSDRRVRDWLRGTLGIAGCLYPGEFNGGQAEVAASSLSDLVNPQLHQARKEAVRELPELEEMRDV